MLTLERTIRDALFAQLDRHVRLAGNVPYFVQVGANDGLTDDPITRCVRDFGWHGILIEPVPESFAALEQNYASNEGLTFLQCAVSDTEGEAEFFVPGNNRVASLSKEFAVRKGRERSKQPRGITVSLRRLDRILAEHGLPRVDLFAIDAEGHDLSVLRSIDFSATHPLLLIYESHNLSREGTTAARELLQGHGYSVIPMHADTLAVSPELTDAATARLLGTLQQRHVAQVTKFRKQIAALQATPPVPAAAPTQRGKLRKTYFAVNNLGLAREFDQVRALVNSCLSNTTLEPHCLFTGDDCPELAWLERRGVRIVRHRSRLDRALRQGYGPKYSTFSGHWLRADLPIVEQEDEFILYTDIDVVFLKDPAEQVTWPAYLGVCAESDAEDRGHFNSGVMVMNLPALRAVDPWFIEAIRERVTGEFKWPPHDQGSLNAFFLPHVNWMSPTLNWKPYWGRNDAASVLHFHGPKPRQLPLLRSGDCQGMKPGLLKLYKRCPKAYDHYESVFRTYSEMEAPRAADSPRSS